MTERITWTNEVRKLRDLQPWPRNPRQISKDQAKRLRESFDQFGQVETIAIGPENEVYNGHQRLAVLLEQHGPDYEIEVRVSSRPLTEKEREKLTVFLHKGAAGEWDFDTLANEFEFSDLIEWGFDEAELTGLDFGEADEPKEDPGAQVDKAEELRQKWQVEPGQLWQLGEHRLICGDCTDAGVVERVMDGEHAELTITSFPYGVGVDYGETFDDTLENVRGLLAILPKIILDITVDGGYAVTNFGDIVSARGALGTDEVCEYPMAVEYWPAFRSVGWYLHSRRIWAKPHARVAAPWCASSNRAASDWEHIWTWKKGGIGLNERRSPSYLGVWDTSKESGVDVGKNVHGAGMALAVPEHCLEIYSNGGALVFEPFSGSGTTLIACERLGRKCRAVEISPAYVAVALERWATMTGREPALLND